MCSKLTVAGAFTLFRQNSCGRSLSVSRGSFLFSVLRVSSTGRKAGSVSRCARCGVRNDSSHDATSLTLQGVPLQAV